MKITKEEYSKLKQLDRIELNTNLLLLDNRYELDYIFWILLLIINIISFGFISIMILILYYNGINLYYLSTIVVSMFRYSGIVILILATLDIGSSLYFKNKAIKKLKERFKL